MAPKHRKQHYARETTDAFAEGWDAHAETMGVKTVNPYRAELAQIEASPIKRSARQVENMRRDAELWDQGWQEQAEDAGEEE